MKLHVTLLSAAIASAMFASPLWADDDKETATPTTTSAPTTGTRPTDNARPPEQRIRETEKDKDDAKAIPKTKPAAGNGGYVQTGKTIHYPGDAFSLRAVVPKSLKDVWEGKAAINIVITMPGGGAISVPVPVKDPNTEGDKVREIVPLPAEVMKTLPAGDYQMAMIVTKIDCAPEPKCDPLNVANWYGGFKAMLGVKRVKVAATTTGDTEDPNKTGNVTGDTDSDGYPDSDPNMPPPPPPVDDNTQQCLLPEGCTTTPTTPPTGGTTTPPTGGTTTPPTGGTTTPPTGGTTTPPTGGTTTPPTGGTTTPPTGGTTPPAADTAAGKTAFDANCTSCHATPSKIMAAADPAKIRAAIDGNKGGMGSLKSLTPQQIGDIAAYVATGG